jgi:hypothetical protein
MEIWQDVKGWEGKYSVSDQGRVLSLRKDWKILKPVIRAGYPSVTLYSNGIYEHYTIHRLVMDTFDENKLGLREVDHLYGDKLDPRLINLERVTSSENKKRAYKLGLIDKRGERHHLSRLTNEQVLEIFNSPLVSSKLASIFKVTADQITAIKRGQQWAHITGKKYQKAGIRQLTKEEVIAIFNDKGTLRGLGQKYNVSCMTVYDIRSGKSHTRITKQLKNN